MNLSQLADAVVMLTWSNWHTEPRSNRYHYAARFAKHIRVLFVQPDRAEPGWRIEAASVPGLQVLHIPCDPGPAQQRALGHALAELGVREPIYWAYNAHFADYLRTAHSAWSIYHATEDYFSEDFFPTGDDGGIRETLRRLLKQVDLVVGVSEGVLQNARDRGLYEGETLLLENGCDYEFWAEAAGSGQKRDRPVALFQGGLNFRVDYELLGELVDLLPEWEFWFCGRQTMSPGWKALLRKPNVTYFGELSPEGIRDLSVSATAGLIPFRQTEMIRRSLPLKAFEYVASGLPVVSVPIDSLRGYSGIFNFADTAAEFAEALIAVRTTRYDERSLSLRREVAAQQSYDRRFEVLIDRLKGGAPRSVGSPRANVLVLYDQSSIHVGTLREHLGAFEQYSRHRVSYAHCTGNAVPPKDISFYDGIIVHYSVRVNLPDHMAKYWRQAVKEFRGFKILFIQDEYDTTETARRFIEEVGINSVFTCVPDSELAKVYSPARFPHVRFINNLTGYVPTNLGDLDLARPLGSRPNVFAYRGRSLPFWYGDLGQEKQRIGQEMRRICEARDLPCDIEWDDSKRIYGAGWFEFLASARATLGTESGANVFDEDGTLRQAISQELRRNPLATYEKIRDKYLVGLEGRVRMNQVSPKIFEAIATRTALVLFEGEYSGVVKPDLHFIPLKKDFGNIDEVLAKVADDQYLGRLTARAFDDVIASGRYSYASFVAGVDVEISRLFRRSSSYFLIARDTDVIDELQVKSMPLVGILGGSAQLPLSHPELDKLVSFQNIQGAPGPNIDSGSGYRQTIEEVGTRDLIKHTLLRGARRGYRLLPLSFREWMAPRWRRFTPGRPRNL